MSQAKAITKYVRISPYKARRSADLIRNMCVEDALLQLRYSNLKGSRLLKKTLDSAIANAQNKFDVKKEALEILEVRVDQGPTIKRSKPRNRGGQVPIKKRTSHFTIVLTAKKEK
ncbi:MAG: 50S ribosomal protein L22 [Candidatus Anoxychlamydiales bacterium]|nr:50S ribosomal protein L22 [Candidatus Anoxychlamydiales bacterium]NGX44294.1 50S ribosomal protein L22 [Candidatus Anoxychlamydiales bacterium]NGX49011.1 50S ribosomal protein L22 [Candidatus Anoxychlamydiales bacterium]NGX52369.1 50S ribosomal protein L22 [Candidatus Anoxychlamydiales bacterium]